MVLPIPKWRRNNMIPLRLETLLSDKVVEQNRVEYKEGWNPNDIIHTICAFANILWYNTNKRLYMPVKNLDTNCSDMESMW